MDKSRGSLDKKMNGVSRYGVAPRFYVLVEVGKGVLGEVVKKVFRSSIWTCRM